MSRERARDAVLLLLAFGAAALDVLSFFALGNVFVGVMTGNILLFGAHLVLGNRADALRSVVALCAYACGAALGSRICGEKPKDAVWSPRLTRALGCETAILCAFAAAWFATAHGVRPPLAICAIVAVGALALGIQSVVSLAIDYERVTTTYATGMATQYVRALVLRSPMANRWLRPSVVAAAAAGAGLSALFLLHAPAAAPLAGIGAIAAAFALAATSLRHGV